MSGDIRADIWLSCYRPIVSDAQAAQLLRHELKHHLKWQQRVPIQKWHYGELLAIKKGNWFKFLKNKRNSYYSIVI